MKRGLKIAACMLLLGFCSSAYAGEVKFFDDFNRPAINDGGVKWVGKDGMPDSLNGKIVADPKNAANRVLTFSKINSGGDTFTSSAFTVDADQFYELKFDYLGVPAAAVGAPAGGFIGVSDGTPGNHNWLAGTQQAYIADSGLPLTTIPGDAASRVLKDDGKWHTYSILFRSNTDQSLRVMIEDFASPAGNAFFDNVQVSAVPVPAAAWIGGALMGALGFVRVLRRR